MENGGWSEGMAAGSSAASGVEPKDELDRNRQVPGIWVETGQV